MLVKGCRYEESKMDPVKDFYLVQPKQSAAKKMTGQGEWHIYNGEGVRTWSIAGSDAR